MSSARALWLLRRLGFVRSPFLDRTVESARWGFWNAYVAFARRMGIEFGSGSYAQNILRANDANAKTAKYRNALSLASEIVWTSSRLAESVAKNWKTTPFDEQTFILAALNVSHHLTHALDCARTGYIKAGFWNLRAVMETCSAIIVFRKKGMKLEHYFFGKVSPQQCISDAARVLPEFQKLHQQISRGIIHEDIRHVGRTATFSDEGEFKDFAWDSGYDTQLFSDLLRSIVWGGVIANQAIESFCGAHELGIYTTQTGQGIELKSTLHHQFLNENFATEADLAKINVLSMEGLDYLSRIERYRVTQMSDVYGIFQNYSARPSLAFIELVGFQFKIMDRFPDTAYTGMSFNILSDLWEALQVLKTGHYKTAGMLLRGALEHASMLACVSGKERHYKKFIKRNLDPTKAPHTADTEFSGIKALYDALTEAFVHESIEEVGRSLFDPPGRFVYGTVYPCFNHRSVPKIMFTFRMFLLTLRKIALVLEARSLQEGEIGVFSQNQNGQVNEFSTEATGLFNRFMKDHDEMFNELVESGALKFRMGDFYRDWKEKNK